MATPHTSRRGRTPRLLTFIVAAVLAGTAAVAAHATASPTTPASRTNTAQPQAVAWAAPPQSPGLWDDAISNPVQDPIYPETGFPETDVLHYYLDLTWDGTTLNGYTTAHVRAGVATSSYRFNLSDALRVSSVTVGGQAMPFTQGNNLLTVTTGPTAPDTRTDIAIAYAGRPQSVRMPSGRGGDVGWQVTPSGAVWTMQEPYGAFTWYPSNDHPSDKAHYDTRITTRQGKMGVFNGQLVSNETRDGNTVTIWHLDAPAASYLTTIGIDAYQADQQIMADGKPYTIWHTAADTATLLPKMRAEAKRSYDWMTAKAGPYPFASAGIVLVDGGDAMETQAMVTLARSIATSPDMSSVVMHELGHHWYGNNITTRTWRDLWLNEGWTMFMEVEFTRAYTLENIKTMCAQSVRTAGQAGNPNKDAFAEFNVYSCPIPALQKVRQDLGDERFFRDVAAAWAVSSPRGHADRPQFMAFLQRVTGKDYSDVFIQWLDKVQPRHGLGRHRLIHPGR